MFKHVKHILRKKPRTQADILAFLKRGVKNGVLDVDTLCMIEGCLLLAQMKVRDIMLPKDKIAMLHEEDSLETMLPIIMESGHSRFPVLSDKGDEIIGILLAKDLLDNHFHEKEFNIDSILRPAIFTPASKRLDVLLGEFRKTRQHIAIVVDEYGKMEGLITLENILEQIVGEIEDEYDYAEEANIRTLSENEYTLKGATPLKEFNKHFKTRFKDKTFKTIAGFLMHQFGELPKIDEKITIENFEFTILSATSRKIRLVKVRLG